MQDMAVHCQVECFVCGGQGGPGHHHWQGQAPGVSVWGYCGLSLPITPHQAHQLQPGAWEGLRVRAVVDASPLFVHLPVGPLPEW